jgi:hypothetical protein
MSSRNLMFNERHCWVSASAAALPLPCLSSACRSTLPTIFGRASFLGLFLVENEASRVYPMLSKDP